MKRRASNFHSRKTEGSALLLALWALLLLSAVVFAWVRFLNANIAAASESNFGFQARALAHSGLQVAMHPNVTPLTPALEQSLGGGGYEVKLTGEGGKLNLNWLLGGEDANRVEVLKRYLSLRGLNYQQTGTLVDSLHDWIDKDNKPRQQGAEESGSYQPPNRGALLSLDEIKQVKGADALTSQPGWSNDFTLWSGGQIDLRYAPQIVIESLPNVTDAQAKRFIEVRQGPDKQDGTQDDKVFKDIAEAGNYLGLTQKQTQAISSMLTLGDSTWRAVSTGRVSNHTRQVEVVFRKGGGQPQILLWKEF